ncbi:hypothetical protein OIDMADRAFT_143091 [Oidiodendron maius Zn]|uniref:CHAT domain-containing protein n=1 Tax=Oidiodendron maius (strain Zn) TaxID=913774 RepID=A0A0C3CWW3_OIDMZ|nr:hypothetical protein OIDMADRAFT_143091 [Oidiodendron maius Zn]
MADSNLDAPSSPQSANTTSGLAQLAATFSAAADFNDISALRSQYIKAAQITIKTMDLGPQKFQVLEPLARACYAEYAAVNDWDALESAIEYYGELIQNTDEDDLENSSRLAAAYARCMQDRFMRGRNEKDLEKAVEFASESVGMTKRWQSTNSTLVIERLGILWLCLFTKVHQLDDSTKEDFDRMMKTAEEANDLAQQQMVETSKVIEAKSNLGIAYQHRWDQQSDFESLEMSLALGREVLDLLPSGQDADARAVALSNLSFRLQRAYLCYVLEKKFPTGLEESKAENLFEDALKYLSDSMSIHKEHLLSDPENTLTFVLYIREFPLECRGYLLAKCVDILRSSVRIIRDYCSVASQNDQRDCLSTFYGLSRYAAAAALQAGETPYQSLLLHEEGRAIMVSLQQEMTDIYSIQMHNEDLANEYSQALEKFRASFKAPTSFYERQSSKKRLAELRERISKIPGIPQVSEQPSEALMHEIAKDRDVVVINVTDLVSNAILITKEAFRVIQLPNLDENQLSEDSWEIQTLLAKEQDQEEVFHDLHTNLSKFLRDLWKNLAKPVLEALGHRQALGKSDSWPSVTWISSGILCLYPIHAAGLGLHTEANTMNRVISSYAPSLSSLVRLHGRESKEKYMDEPTEVVIVSMPETTDRSSLDLSTDEAAAIAQNFPNSTLLKSQTTEQVLSAVAKEPHIVHFSCHGEVDYSQPLLSKMLTSNWQTSPLTVADLQMLNIKRSRLAFLSACFTANAGVENMQDEGNHIAGALHCAGFSNVVGSSWYVGERAALEVTKRFYEELARAGESWTKDVAKALHFAVMDFRENTRTAGNRMRGDPVSWAPFLHFGG